MHYKKWSSEEDETLKELFKTKTVKEISVLINRTQGATRSRLDYLGFKKPIPELKIKSCDVATKAYIAGIIDGEGHIGIVKTKILKENKIYYNYQVNIEVHNTDKRLCLWLQDKCGGYFGKGSRPNGKGYYRWSIANKNAYSFIEEIYDYLVIKKEQADVIKKYQSTISNKNDFTLLGDEIRNRRNDLYEQLKKLHHSFENDL